MSISPVVIRIALITAISSVLLMVAMFLGVSMGSSGAGWSAILETLKAINEPGSTAHAIIWKIRFPRVMLAGIVGAVLSVGGLVFQALLRNPLAEPYILGISGGAAIGAIIGIMLGLTGFAGSGILAFAGGMATLFLVLGIASGPAMMKKESLLLSGVMVNAFCSAVIMFLISLSMDARLHNIMFWLMGDLSSSGKDDVFYLAMVVAPCFLVIFLVSHSLNILLMGREMAHSMGINVKLMTMGLLMLTSFMISTTVAQVGLIAFVGLVVPHLLRLILGSDHRELVPACILGGAAYMILCDLLARVLPRHGEMPVGVITAMVGAPLFIYLLRRSR